MADERVCHYCGKAIKAGDKVFIQGPGQAWERTVHAACVERTFLIKK